MKQLATLVLGTLALGNVATDRLVLDDPALVVEEAAVAPLLPAELAVRTQDLVLRGCDRALGRNGRKECPRGPVPIQRDEVPEGAAEKLPPRALEVPAVGVVDERVRPVGKEPAYQLGLVFDDRAITGLAESQRLLLAAPFLNEGR